MTTQSPDPFDELRAADPVHGAPAPSESKARVWARIQEVTMATPTRADERRQNWTLGFGAAAIAVFFAWALLVGGPAAPAPQPVGGVDGGAAGGGAAGICLAYSVEELANRDFAFDGTVTAIDGDQATFTVNESFIGDLTGSVTLTAPVSSEDIAFEGGTELVPGERYLVSGDDGIRLGLRFHAAVQRYARRRVGHGRIGLRRRPRFMRPQTDTTKEGPTEALPSQFMRSQTQTASESAAASASLVVSVSGGIDRL